MNVVLFFDFEPKNCIRVPTPWGFYGAKWDERYRSLCTFQTPCYVGGFGDLVDHVLPTERDVSANIL